METYFMYLRKIQHFLWGNFFHQLVKQLFVYSEESKSLAWSAMDVNPIISRF